MGRELARSKDWVSLVTAAARCTIVTSRVWELADSCHDDRGEHQSKYPSCIMYTGILAVHVFRYPCNLNALADIARRHNLELIYDAAHTFE